MTFTVRDLENLSSVVMSLINIPVLTDSELGYILSGSGRNFLLSSYFLALASHQNQNVSLIVGLVK